MVCACILCNQFIYPAAYQPDWSFPVDPAGIVAAESGLMPARALLNHRQARFTQRLYARPADGSGPEEILSRERSALTERLRALTALRPGDSGGSVVARAPLFPRQDLRRGEGRGSPDGKWMETPRHGLDRRLSPRQRRGGAGCVWRAPRGWTGHRFHQGPKRRSSTQNSTQSTAPPVSLTSGRTAAAGILSSRFDGTN